MKKLALALCLIAAGAAVHAEKVYKVIQPDGTVLFTDTPPADGSAEEVEVAPLNVTPPLASPRDAFDDTAAAGADKGYSAFRITSPGGNEAIRDNAGNVSVSLSLEPALRSGDKIDLLMDGRSVASGTTTSISLTNVDRGTHSLQGVVKNSAGKVVAKSNTVSFTLQRRSAVLQPAPPS
jgi:hypothetical protein